MTRKIKTFGLAMIAVLAMSALVASAAQAQFTTNAAPTTVTAISFLGNDIFTIDGGSVECTGHFEGTAAEGSVTSITVKATYTNCRAFGYPTATVHMNGCDYVFYAGAKKGLVDVACPTGKAITITAGNCEVQIKAQTGLKTVLWSNHHPHVDAQAAVTGITANRTHDGWFCPLSGTGHALATYVQQASIHVEPKSGGNTISVH